MTSLPMKKFTADLMHDETKLGIKHKAEMDALKAEHEAELHAMTLMLKQAHRTLDTERELVNKFATKAGLLEFENKDLRRQLAEAQKIINTYSVKLGELHRQYGELPY